MTHARRRCISLRCRALALVGHALDGWIDKQIVCHAEIESRALGIGMDHKWDGTYINATSFDHGMEGDPCAQLHQPHARHPCFARGSMRGRHHTPPHDAWSDGSVARPSLHQRVHLRLRRCSRQARLQSYAGRCPHGPACVEVPERASTCMRDVYVCGHTGDPASSIRRER
jgi:hypothetical protein